MSKKNLEESDSGNFQKNWKTSEHMEFWIRTQRNGNHSFVESHYN